MAEYFFLTSFAIIIKWFFQFQDNQWIWQTKFGTQKNVTVVLNSFAYWIRTFGQFLSLFRVQREITMYCVYFFISSHLIVQSKFNRSYIGRRIIFSNCSALSLFIGEMKSWNFHWWIMFFSFQMERDKIIFTCPIYWSRSNELKVSENYVLLGYKLTIYF